ncbi:hypothetical protein [Levilactobacillus zymae]|uniref:hypothetical protein n=1 Tax=Levilactobacillus zymae TaxID=267363 RepID=UPI0028BC40D4|nr:hypothetical protein [Levilactobacillus zymae]MDT6981586.1 hypothetical protein [Levilactobacillus zymae]
MRLKTCLIVPLVVAGAVSLFSTPSQAKTYQIGNEQVAASQLYKFKYYQAKRTTKARVQFDDNSFKFIKIPKGTIVQGSKDNHEMGVMVAQLNYSLFNQKRPRNKPYASSIGMQYAKNPQDFKRVARPAYMPAYSSGRLYQGKLLANARRRDTTFFHITSNGYVDYRKYAAGTQYQFNDKPQHQVKIQRTKVHGNTRELFLSKKFSGLSFKKVKYQGKTQYRLNVINLHKPFLTVGQSDDDIPSVYYSNYLVGGQKMYTEIANSELM